MAEAEDKSWLDAAPIIQPAVSPEPVAPRRVAGDTARGQSLDQALAGIQAPDITSVRVPTLEGMRDSIQQADMSALQYLQPGPDASTPEIALRRAAQVGVHGLSTLAQLPINVLMGLGQGPDAVTINPQTGTMGLTPEAQTTVSMAATPLRFGGSSPSFVPPGTLDQRADLTGVRPVDPGVTARVAGREQLRETQGAPAPAVTPTGAPPPTPPRTATPAVTAEPLPDLATSAGARRVANYYYKKAEEEGGILTPQFTDRFIDNVNKNLPQTEMGRAVAGESEAAALAKRLQDQRGKPMTLQALQEADEGITGLITKEWGVKGISKDGVRLQETQRGLRDQIMSAGEGDIEGGAAGFDALSKGRRAWSASMLLRDLEAIQERASRTEQPSTSIRTQVRTLLGNASKARWYSPEEIAALEDAAQRGVLGGAFHVAGSRLVPMLAGTIGFSTSGPIGALIQGGAAGLVSSGARSVATRLQESRLGRVADIVSRRVPPYPRNQIGP